MNINFFSFFDIPELLIKKELGKKDLTNAIELINEAKEEYINDKAKALGKNTTLDLTVTEDDLAPLELLNVMLERRKERHLEQ